MVFMWFRRVVGGYNFRRCPRLDFKLTMLDSWKARLSAIDDCTYTVRRLLILTSITQ